MEHARPSRRGRFARRSVVVGAAAAAATLWWQWPALAGHRERTDVVVIADDLLGPGREALEYHLRDSGRTVATTAQRGWCDPAIVGEATQAVHPSGTIVLAYSGDEPCDVGEVVGVLRREAERVVVVRRPGSGWPTGLVDSSAVLVEPERLVGDGSPSVVLPCEWWDAVWLEPCGVDGAVPVTDSAGALTEQGLDRLARMVTAAIAG